MKLPEPLLPIVTMEVLRAMDADAEGRSERGLYRLTENEVGLFASEQPALYGCALGCAKRAGGLNTPHGSQVFGSYLFAWLMLRKQAERDRAGAADSDSPLGGRPLPHDPHAAPPTWFVVVMFAVALAWLGAIVAWGMR